MAVDKISHVISQLSMQASRLHPINKTGSIWIKCPLHGGGNEDTPSCKVNTTGTGAPVGNYFCFGCKQKGGWNRLAGILNLAGFKAADQINDVFAFSIQTDDGTKTRLPKYEKLKLWPKGKSWRKIDSKTMRLFNGCKPDNPVFEDEFIYFPVLINKRHAGGIYARKIVSKKTKKLGLSSYLNTSGSWTKEALFGYNIAKARKGPLWIVEGPRDTMKIVMLGGRVVGLCGAYVSPKKISLIQALDPSCIIIATDPDDAGDRAREQLKEALTMFPIFEAVFPEGRDPGNFTQKSYDKMMLKLGLGKYVKRQRALS